jgi:putative ABC transport system ATP-binding protein
MIKTKNLNKISSDVEILRDINLDIEENSFVAIKGASGAGKSTLLSIIGGMDKPTSGEINIGGLSISKLPDYHISNFRNEKLGFIFQAYHIVEDLTLYQNIALVLKNYSKKEIEKRVLSVAKRVGISKKLQTKAKDLSGGEQQRCAIARAIVNNPILLLCDEPTANLDHKNRDIFFEILDELKNRGVMIIVATHDENILNNKLVDRVITISDGRIVYKN